MYFFDETSFQQLHLFNQAILVPYSSVTLSVYMAYMVFTVLETS